MILPTSHCYTIEVMDSGKQFHCGPTEFVLLAMLKRGKKGIPVGCRNGGCGICKINIRSGEYQLGKMSRAHVSEAEEKDGFALACRCIPQSNLRVQVVGKVHQAITSS